MYPCKWSKFKRESRQLRRPEGQEIALSSTFHRIRLSLYPLTRWRSRALLYWDLHGIESAAANLKRRHRFVAHETESKSDKAQAGKRFQRECSRSDLQAPVELQ